MENDNESGKRRQKRFVITLHAKVVIGSKTYDGVLGNVSAEGVSSTITTYIKTDDQFIPHKMIQLLFELPSGENISLDCEIRWFLRPREHGSNLILGLYIVDPPSIYTQWINRFS